MINQIVNGWNKVNTCHSKGERVIAGFLIPLLLLTAVLFVTACDKTEDSPTGSDMTAQDHIYEGWKRFEEQRWDDALGSFQAAMGSNGNLADAWNGAGWTEGQQTGKLASAANRFAVCLQKDSTRYDAIAGWAFIEYQQNRWQSAINKADSLLHRRPRWKFLHQQQLDFYDIHLMKAKSHYLLGEYTASLDVIKNLLNPEFTADVSTPFGRQLLSDEIERLERIYG